MFLEKHWNNVPFLRLSTEGLNSPKSDHVLLNLFPPTHRQSKIVKGLVWPCLGGKGLIYSS